MLGLTKLLLVFVNVIPRPDMAVYPEKPTPPSADETVLRSGAVIVTMVGEEKAPAGTLTATGIPSTVTLNLAPDVVTVLAATTEV